ncbi:nucleoporin Nup35 [Drosophila sechellia]|uniref:Nucleoporin NUP53 n=1 Tax=Drosophila sechellia TaxID=7238 RepID=B4I6V0_DROSE|nr:nucleoporin Nup35 [Drosophila sechellia]EDW56048.1 GM22908 [Drosophila sechellia]
MEPMNLGSPVNSPGSNQTQYLPPFLLGDPQGITPHKNTLSPKTGRSNISFATSPGGSSPHELNRTALSTRTLFAAQGGGSMGPNVSHTVVGSNSSTPAHGQSHRHHQTGPPTQGLFDSLREQSVTPKKKNHLGMLQLQSPNQSYQSSYHTNDSFAPINATNASMRALCSPLGATASPAGGLSTSMTAGGSSRISDLWVTIFGFPPGASSMVLQHFTVCGTIVDVVHAPQNGNWMYVRYSSRIESDKALNYNEKVIAGNVMVGVSRCTERSVLDKENIGFAANAEIGDPPASPSVIRPFSQQSYKLARKDNIISPMSDVPQKSSGLVNRAMDLIFGW